MNHIAVVSGSESITAQARSYAEYRVFAVMARHAPRVRSVKVVLRYTEDGGARHQATCAVTVTLESASSFRIRGTGPHVYAAINRAVERFGIALARRVEQPLLPVIEPSFRRSLSE
ncbi:MAG: hypothetical protein ABI880_08325 [Acidobacteriota bacterium]